MSRSPVTKPSSTPKSISSNKSHRNNLSNAQEIEVTKAENDVNVNLPLEQQSYFHGVLPRQEIQRLLRNHGDFIARMTKKQDEINFVISVNWHSEHLHVKLNCDNEMKWKIEKKRFNTIPELIHYYYTTGVPITRKTGAVLLNPKRHEKWELDNDQIELKDKLGSGAFGEVYKGILVLNGEKIEVAVKLCRESMEQDQKKKFVEEAHFMRSFDHPNIVKLFGVAASREPIMIVMEFVDGGGLDTFLKSNQGRLSVRLKTKFVVMASRGMEYLESNQCIHRDLAARNCLVDNQKILKISDFGLSRSGDEYKVQSQDIKIPVRWTAPEALLTRTFTLKSDVWSFGILMWEVFTEGEVPYPGLMENIDVLRMLKTGKRLNPPSKMPAELNTVMQQCWHKEPSSRPSFGTISELLENIYFALQSQNTVAKQEKSQITVLLPPPSSKINDTPSGKKIIVKNKN